MLQIDRLFIYYSDLYIYTYYNQYCINLNAPSPTWAYKSLFDKTEDLFMSTNI